MSLFGLTPETPVHTPGGVRTLGSLEPGEVVWTWDAARRRRVERAIKSIVTGSASTLYEVAAEGGLIRGATPGLIVYDAFEGLFRGVGSLSSTTELWVWDGEGVRVAPMDHADERAGPPQAVLIPIVEGEEGTFFAGGVVVRHGRAS